MTDSTAPALSVAIPLHGSRPFIDVVSANIDAIERDDVEILLSDRTGLDDALDILAARYQRDRRVHVRRDADGADWVTHCNSLLRQARGEYFCWMPHDDDFPSGWLDLLSRQLTGRPELVMAFGRIEPIELDGAPAALAIKHPRAGAVARMASVRNAVDILVSGGVAFRGLFRRAPVVDRRRFIPRTRDCVHADRAWVYRIALLGPMLYVPEAVTRKRYHPTSVHAGWSARRPSHRLSLAGALARSAFTDAKTVRDGAVALGGTIVYTSEPLIRRLRGRAG